MANVQETPKKWRKWLLRFTFAGTLMGISFAAVGVTLGLVNTMSASANATTNELYFGDSQTRLGAVRH